MRPPAQAKADEVVAVYSHVHRMVLGAPVHETVSIGASTFNIGNYSSPRDRWRSLSVPPASWWLTA